MTAKRLFTFTPYILVLALSGVLLLTQGCFPSDPMDAEMARLISKTSPANSVILQREDPENRDGHSHASWTFGWNGDWQSYGNWVRNNLLDSYSVVRSGARQMAFRGNINGSVFTLVIEPAAEVSQARVTLISEKL